MTEEKNRRALVLSGGGGRGAYQIGALTYLEKVNWQPDLIVGTSIGAVNAVALGSGIPLEGLSSRWLDMETGDFQLMRADDVFIDNLIMRRTHIFDTKPLLETIRGRNEKWQGRPWIFPEVLNGEASPYDIWITAVDAKAHRLVYFYNRSATGIEPKMVQASCSIPLWYEPTSVNGRSYLDGGTIANTPFRKAIMEQASEIVVVLMSPWPGRAVTSWEPTRKLDMPEDEFLKIPQALWSAFEPALDMLLREIVWKDYLLLEEERRAGKHPHLKWIRFIAPDKPLPTGNMTVYQRDNHVRLFHKGERDAQEILQDLLGDIPRAGKNGKGYAR